MSDEDVVVSSPNLRSLTSTEQRDLARKEKPPFDDDDQDGFDLPLSLEFTIPKNVNVDVDLFKKSLTSILSKVVANYEDEDNTKVLGFALANEGGDGDGRELASQTVVTVGFVLTLVLQFAIA